MNEKPIYIFRENDAFFDCEKWNYSKPKDFAQKKRLRQPMPECERQSNQKIEDVDLSDYSFLMALGNKTFFISKEFEAYKIERNAYATKVRDRLIRIKNIQIRNQQMEEEKLMESLAFDKANIIPYFKNWGRLVEHCRKIKDTTDLPDPVDGFEWYRFNEEADELVMNIELNMETQQYNRSELIYI